MSDVRDTRLKCQCPVALLCCRAEVSLCTHLSSTLSSHLSRSHGVKFLSLRLCSQAIKAPKCSVLSLQEVETHELVFLWTLTPLAILKMHWDDSALHKHKSRKKRLIFLRFRVFWFVCFFGWTLGFFGWFFWGVGSWFFCV